MQTSKNEWKKMKLSDLGFVGRGKSKHRPRNDPVLYDGNYPFIQTGDVKKAELYISDYTQTYNEDGLAQSKLWDENTLCITIAANIAETAILKMKACFPDSIIGFIPDPEKSDVKFIKYYIDEIKLSIQNVSKGTTQDNLSLNKLSYIDFYIPPLRIQKKIVFVLSAFDDLIENNMVRIKILEQMAKDIFKKWFIKFQFPGNEQFELVESKCGMIPEGWEVKELADVCKFKYGKGLPKKRRIPGKYPVYGSGGLIDHHESPLIKGPGIIIGRKGSIGTIFYEREDFFPIDTVFYITENESSIALEFLYYLLKTLNLDKLNSDAAVPGLNRDEAHQQKVIIPTNELIKDFQKIIVALFDLHYNLEEKNKNLRQTRDLLLPKLISGEINVENLKYTSLVE